MAEASLGSERIPQLDALRGFALFGILLANILAWSGWFLISHEENAMRFGTDAVAWQYRFHHLLIDGKFYTIFSLLFGAGFALQIARLQARGAPSMKIYRRRLFVLLGIGLIHSWLIWEGDILTIYALLGFALPLFYGLSERALLIAGAALVLVVPPLGIALFDLLGWRPQDALYELGDGIATALGADTSPEKLLDWVRRDDLAGWFSWILSGTPFSLGSRIETWRFPKILGVMLIGMVAGRRISEGQLIGNRKLLRWVFAIGLAVGVPFNLAYAVFPGLGQTDWPSLFGTLPMGLAYAAGFLLLWPRASSLFVHLVPVGRMALTNYIAQSIFGTLIFFGIGLGLVGTMNPLQIYAVAIAIFALQIVFSHWWLGKHRQGPLEKAWRDLTYRAPDSATG